jgi:hypothetical protein
MRDPGRRWNLKPPRAELPAFGKFEIPSWILPATQFTTRPSGKSPEPESCGTSKRDSDANTEAKLKSRLVGSKIKTNPSQNSLAASKKTKHAFCFVCPITILAGLSA